MSQSELLNEFLSLPVEVQRQIVDFIAFLRQKHAVIESASQSPDIDFINHSFIGMWSDRQDFTDSTNWVRAVRECEW
ncbi:MULTISPECIES: hypothetical protein [unclassified Anabaena]|uniref:hypothetical protein n=1 Tax=unclassified Anabaena TaxID=2619674 RepID=UPI0039C6B61D